MRILRGLAVVCATLLTAGVCGAALAQSQDNARPGGGCVNTAGARPAYPFDVARVANAFKRAPDDPSERKVRVVIFDNGFLGYRKDGANNPEAAPNFPRPFFFATDSNGYKAANDYLPLPMGFDDQAWLKGHGTHVTGLVLGGSYGGGGPKNDEDWGAPEVRKLFFIDYLGKPQGDGAANDWIDLYVVGLSKDGLSYNEAALSGIKTLFSNEVPYNMRKATIINLSLSYTPNSDVVPDDIQNLPGVFPNALLVAAAGNGYTAVKEGQGGQYPAASNRTVKGNLIVVGSHDSNGKRSPFSNFDAEKVTLAAPGCQILSWNSGGGEAEPEDGTSQAAALVSFAAVLLQTRWARADPLALRERLIVSSRYSNDLATGCVYEGQTPSSPKVTGACVRYGSMLDIEMALRFNTDAIEFCRDDDQRSPLECDTQVALGDIRAVPTAFLCAGAAAIKAPGDTGLTRPMGIRRINAEAFQVIYRRKGPGTPDGETLGINGCENAAVTTGEVDMRRVGAQPDAGTVIQGDPTLKVPVARIVRIVTRSTGHQYAP